MRIRKTKMENQKCNKSIPETEKHNRTITEIRIPDKKMEPNHLAQVLLIIKDLCRQVESDEDVQISNPYAKLIYKSLSAVNVQNLKNLEYVFSQIHKYSKNTTGYFTPSFIEFAACFGERCNKSTSLFNNFRVLFEGLSIKNNNDLITKFFEMVFYDRTKCDVNFFTLSAFAGLERISKIDAKYMKIIKKRLLLIYIADIFNKYKPSVSTGQLKAEDFDRLSVLLDLKINAINGCLFKNILNITQLDKLIFLYLYFKAKSTRLSFMNDYTDGVLFYMLLIHVNKLHSKTSETHILQRNNIKMLLLIDLKWKLTDENNKFVDFEDVYHDFNFDVNNIVGVLIEIKFRSYKPKYTFERDKEICQIIETPNGFIYTHKVKSPPNDKLSTNNKISPFSGRLNNSNNIEPSENAINKKKLNFE